MRARVEGGIVVVIFEVRKMALPVFLPDNE
jgi:hypothetical protein